MNYFADLPLWFNIALAILLGLLVGSFLNVVIHRLPIMMEQTWRKELAEMNEQTVEEGTYNLITPRSACPQCGHQITALENIPVISWLFLKGKCSGCGTPISKRYPAIELLTGVLAGLLIAWFGPTLQGAAALVLLFFLIPLTFIDADTQLLPDDLTLPLLWAGLLFNLNGTFAALNDAVIGAVAGYLILWSIYWAFKLLTGKEGMGYGDFKLLAALGAWMGWQMLPIILLLSSVVGVIIGLSQIAMSRMNQGQTMPFGPYLCCAGLVALLVGNRIYGLLGF